MSRGMILSVILGALFTGVLLVRDLTGQPRAASLRGWPPAPQDIVNLNGHYSMGAGGSLVVYTVPANQWLVVTNLEIYWINTGASIDLYEDAAGMLTLKRSSWFNGWGGNAANVTNGPYESPVGLAFAPGSKVTFVNPQGNGENGEYHLTAYLANP